MESQRTRQTTNASLYYHRRTSPEIRAAAERDTLILIPVGQVEEHGNHLPLDTDCVIAQETAMAVASDIAGELPVLVLPTVWNAYSVQQVAQWPGLITFREPETMIQMIYDITASLVRDGFRKIVFVNAHGNNPAILELASRRIGSDYNVFPAVTYVLGMSKTIGPSVRKSEIGGCGGHAGEEETALMLHLAPETVRMDRSSAEDIVKHHTRFFPGDIYASNPGGVGGLYWSTWGVIRSTTGVYGDPTIATAETGQALFTEIVRNYREFLIEFYAHSEGDA